MSNSVNKKEHYNDYCKSINDKIGLYNEAIAGYIKNKNRVISELNDVFAKLKPAIIKDQARLRIMNVADDELRDNMKVALLTDTCDKSTSIDGIKAIAFVSNKSDMYKRIVKINMAISATHTKIHNEKSFILSYKDYVYMTDELNKDVTRKLALGERVHLDSQLGYLQTLKVIRKDYNRKRISFNQTKKYKASVIANGGIPYNKADAEEAARLGIEYKGVDCNIYDYSDYYLYVKWKRIVYPYGRYYEFVPYRGDNKQLSRDAIINRLTKVTDIFKYNMGLVKYLNILDKTFPDYNAMFLSTNKD